MTREPSVFPVAPATVFPADSKPGVPDGLCDQRGAPMSTSAEEVIGQKLKVLYGMAVSDGAWFVEALNDAGFVVVPPDEGWRVVKLSDEIGNARGDVPLNRMLYEIAEEFPR